jgi:cysteine desulfurase
MIYLDHGATTPLRPEARAAMEPLLAERYGNAASLHGAGRGARAALEEARGAVAGVLGADRSEIVFTGGGTEADNLAVLGRWRAAGGGVAVSAIEHSAVLEAAAQAGREGAAVTVVAVHEDGTLDLGALNEALEEPQAVVSVMWGNNEVGTLQPVALIAELCRERGAVFHTDAVQAVGHVPVSVREVRCDLLALSAHKFGGPQGVGALFVRRGTALTPLVHGGGQEYGLRAGTANVAGAVGLAAALEVAAAELARESARLGALRDRLQASLLERIPGLRVHGSQDSRLPHVLNVAMDAVEADVLLPALDLAGLAISAGSACHTGASTPSHVLLAMGVERGAAIRFSLGWTTTAEDIAAAIEGFTRVVDRVRAARVPS